MAIGEMSHSRNVCNLTEQPRPALLSRTNSPPRVDILLPGRQVRRKNSFKFRIDSSEAIPSSHQSVYHAEYFSNPNSKDENYKIETWPVASFNPNAGQTFSLPQIWKNENIRDQLLPSPAGVTPIIYGHGTALTTIVEQKSNATISTKFSVPYSKSDPGRITPLAHDTSTLNQENEYCIPSTVTLRSPRRRRSFSADDLVFIKRAYHNACSSIESNIRRPWEIQEVYAAPQIALLTPPDRPPTSVGMPSWTTNQNAPKRAAIPQPKGAMKGTPNRLQRFLHLERRPTEFSSDDPPTNQLQQGQSAQPVFGRSVSNPLPFRHTPRFRSPKSEHGVGPLEHPFRRIGSREFKSEPYPGGPQLATPNNASSFGTGRKTRKTPDRSAHAKVQVPGGESRKLTKCPAHHQDRLGSLRFLRNPFNFAVSKPSHRIIPVEPPTPTNSPRIRPQYSIPLSPIIDAGNPYLAQNSAIEPLMSDIINDSYCAPSPAGAQTSLMTSSDEDHHGIPNMHCLKCRFSGLGAKLDEFWVAGTSWCYWIFCGVDINEFEDDDAVVGCRELGPRRVLLDGTNVFV